MVPRPAVTPKEPQQSKPSEGLYIKQVASMIGVSPTVLRSWEASGLVNPARSSSGFRVYTLEDVIRLQRIRDLTRGQGVNLAGVRAILDSTREGDVTTKAEPTTALGDRLRSLRAESGLSLRDLASKTGLSASFISAIERSATRPSVASLQKLASALGTNLVSLMDEKGTQASSVVVKKSDRRQVELNNPGVTIEELATVETQLEPLMFHAAPGAGSGSSYTHDGEEFIYVLEGLFEITLDELERYTLEAGDAMTFASIRPHRFRNPGKSEAVVLWINTPPTF